MTRSKGRKYNDDKMVHLIAASDLNDAEIGRQLNISTSMVWRIRHGQSRADLQERINDAIRGYIRELRLHVLSRLKKLADKHMEVGMEGESEIARRCREFMMKLFMVDVPPADEPAPAIPVGPRVRRIFHNLPSLSPNLKTQMIDELDLSRPNTGCGD
ncbi:MAG: hypothetical protein HN350_09235 [Phycisphaerales bacterium]|jgi:hypothetical protein|nr:hypothetical protein [Phycisphaerales bacterium]